MVVVLFFLTGQGIRNSPSCSLGNIVPLFFFFVTGQGIRNSPSCSLGNIVPLFFMTGQPLKVQH